MATDEKSVTLGKAIDRVIAVLEGLEKPTQSTAIRAACEHLGLPFGPTSSSRVSSATPEPALAQPTDVASIASITDIRSLRRAKAPATATEMACVVAYYLQEIAPPDERKDLVNAADLKKYFKQANFPLPKAGDQLPFNVRSAGYFDSVGGGQFKLNPVGYNVVAHSLPRGAEKSGQQSVGRKKARPRKRDLKRQRK